MIEKNVLNEMLIGMYENSLKNVSIVMLEALRNSEKDEVYENCDFDIYGKDYKLKVCLKEMK